MSDTKSAIAKTNDDVDPNYAWCPVQYEKEDFGRFAIVIAIAVVMAVAINWVALRL